MRSPQDRVNPSDQLLEIKRLGDVVVGSERQAANAVVLLRLCRQHENGDAPLPS